MYWKNFWQPTVHVQLNIFEKKLIEIGSSHLYTSFGIFCVQIGQFLEAQWVFEKCLKTAKSSTRGLSLFLLIWAPGRLAFPQDYLQTLYKSINDFFDGFCRHRVCIVSMRALVSLNSGNIFAYWSKFHDTKRWADEEGRRFWDLYNDFSMQKLARAHTWTI